MELELDLLLLLLGFGLGLLLVDLELKLRLLAVMLDLHGLLLSKLTHVLVQLTIVSHPKKLASQRHSQTEIELFNLE